MLALTSPFLQIYLARTPHEQKESCAAAILRMGSEQLPFLSFYIGQIPPSGSTGRRHLYISCDYYFYSLSYSLSCSLFYSLFFLPDCVTISRFCYIPAHSRQLVLLSFREMPYSIYWFLYCCILSRRAVICQGCTDDKSAAKLHRNEEYRE